MHSVKLIVVSGLSGSGKSTLAQGIARTLHVPIFSVDPIESAIISSGIQRSFETGWAAYLVAQTLAAEQLRQGQSVIIDAVSPVKISRKMWQKLSRTYHAPLIIIECVLDSQTHKKRIKARVRNIPGIPEVTWQNVQSWKKEYLPWQEERLTLDTAYPNEVNIKKAILYIESK